VFLIQDCFQQGDKVVDGITGRIAHGVIWSPGDLAPATLTKRSNSPALGKTIQAIDTQVYVAALTSANDKKLPDYLHYSTARKVFRGTGKVSDVVGDAMLFQRAHPVSVLLSPTVAIDAYQPKSLFERLTRESLRQTDPEESPLLISVAPTGALLSSDEAVDELLVFLTTLKCAGFYLLHEVNCDLDATVVTDRLSRALKITKVLSEAQYRVWVGYAGLSGYLHRAVGAEAYGCGWWEKSRAFSMSNWGDGGGSTPYPRVFLTTILASLKVAEIIALNRSSQRVYKEVIAGPGPVAKDYRRTPPVQATFRNPSRDSVAAQLFSVCTALDDRVDNTAAIDVRVQDVRREIEKAAGIYRRLGAAVALEPKSQSTHLGIWDKALVALGREEGFETAI
jgi:hypothetical protein